MPKAQLEDGYTRIANQILDSLSQCHLSSYEWRCLWVVLRKTYGWNKKRDWISLSQFVKTTKIKKPHVCRTLKMLIKQNIITKGGTPKQPLYGFQKDSSRWVSLPKGVRSHHVTKGGNKALPKGVIRGVPKGAHTKDTITKETIQKKYPSLKDIKEIDIKEIAKQYGVPENFVYSKLDDMTNWLEAKGKKYKNYKSALRNWVKKDAIERIDNAKHRNNKVSIDASNL